MTVSVSPPIFMLTLTDRVSPTTSTMPVCSKVLKPLSLRCELVGTDRQVGEDVATLSSVMTNRVIPVSVWVMVTSTPGSAPPDSSRTVPDSWATATVWAHRSARAAAGHQTNKLSVAAFASSRRSTCETPESALRATLGPHHVLMSIQHT